MPLDASIYNPLLNMPNWAGNAINAGVQGYNLGSAIKEAPMRNRLLESQARSAELSAEAQDYDLQLTDMATDAIQIKQLLEADPTGVQANVALAQRIKKIMDRGGDPSDTMAARDMLNSGNVQGFMAELEAPIQAATQLGLLNRGQAGSVASQDRAALLKAIQPALDENGRFDPKKADANALSAAYELNLVAKPGTLTGAERIPMTGMTETVAGSQETIERQKRYGSDVGKGAAGLESLSDQWDANREFIVSAVPGIQDVLERSPGSSLGKATSSFLSKSIGGMDVVDAQAELEQFGAMLLQGVPFAPGAQSDKELQARAKLVSDQIEDPNISPSKKIEIIRRFVDYQDAKATAQRRIADRKMQKEAEVKPKTKDYDLEYDPATGTFR